MKKKKIEKSYKERVMDEEVIRLYKKAVMVQESLRKAHGMFIDEYLKDEEKVNRIFSKIPPNNLTKNKKLAVATYLRTEVRHHTKYWTRLAIFFEGQVESLRDVALEIVKMDKTQLAGIYASVEPNKVCVEYYHKDENEKEELIKLLETNLFAPHSVSYWCVYPPNLDFD